MKKILKNKKLLIVILIILILLSILLILLLLPRKKPVGYSNNYNFAESIPEIPGTEVYTNDELKKAHCVDNVCVEEVTFYYKENKGRVEYTIMNRNTYTVSGTLKMVFGDKHVLVSYANLEPKTKIKSSSSYVGVDIKNKENYKLKKLSKEEIKKIIKK